MKLYEEIEAWIDGELSKRMTMVGCRIVLPDELRDPVVVPKVIESYRLNNWDVKYFNGDYDFIFKS